MYKTHRVMRSTRMLVERAPETNGCLRSSLVVGRCEWYRVMYVWMAHISERIGFDVWLSACMRERRRAKGETVEKAGYTISHLPGIQPEAIGHKTLKVCAVLAGVALV